MRTHGFPWSVDNWNHLVSLLKPEWFTPVILPAKTCDTRSVRSHRPVGEGPPNAPQTHTHHPSFILVNQIAVGLYFAYSTVWSLRRNLETIFTLKKMVKKCVCFRDENFSLLPHSLVDEGWLTNLPHNVGEGECGRRKLGKKRVNWCEFWKLPKRPTTPDSSVPFFPSDLLFWNRFVLVPLLLVEFEILSKP